MCVWVRQGEFFVSEYQKTYLRKRITRIRDPVVKHLRSIAISRSLKVNNKVYLPFPEAFPLGKEGMLWLKNRSIYFGKEFTPVYKGVFGVLYPLWVYLEVYDMQEMPIDVFPDLCQEEKGEHVWIRRSNNGWTEEKLSNTADKDAAVCIVFSTQSTEHKWSVRKLKTETGRYIYETVPTLKIRNRLYSAVYTDTIEQILEKIDSTILRKEVNYVGIQ